MAFRRTSDQGVGHALWNAHYANSDAGQHVTTKVA